MHRLRPAAKRTALAVAGSLSTASATVLAVSADGQPTELRPPEPVAPDLQYVRTLAQRWTEEEETTGYTPKAGRWPPARDSGLRGDIKGLQSDLKRCGSGGDPLDNGECHDIVFKLGVAYLGGTIFGHPQDGERASNEIAHGMSFTQPPCRLPRTRSSMRFDRPRVCRCGADASACRKGLGMGCVRLGLLPGKRRRRGGGLLARGALLPPRGGCWMCTVDARAWHHALSR